MNRTQAIQSAKNLRRGMTVYEFESERVAAVQAVTEIKTEEGEVLQPAIAAVAAAPRKYRSTTYKTIGEAKRAMRAIGCGVALQKGETVPQ